jgi:hypothetical protein
VLLFWESNVFYSTSLTSLLTSPDAKEATLTLALALGMALVPTGTDIVSS